MADLKDIWRAGQMESLKAGLKGRRMVGQME